MVRKKLTTLLAATAALALLAVPAFAEDADAAAPAADSTAIVQQDEASLSTEMPETEPASESEGTELPAETTEPDAPAAEPEDTQLTYVALGDSITAGVGLEGYQFRATATREDLEPNFEGYPSQCYVSLVADGLGLDRQHAIDLGLPGLQSDGMLRLVRASETEDPSWYYYYPQYRDYIRNADIISIQIGSNDATVPAFAALSDATHQKSEQLVGVLVNGTMRDLSPESFRSLNDSLSKLAFTSDEIRAVSQLLFEGGTDAICEQAYQNVTTNLPQIIAEIRALNPDAKILLLGYTNPVPVLAEWSDYFNRLNRFARDLAKQNENVTFVSISLTPSSSTDGHPTICGHRYIANRMLKALR